MTVFSVVFGLYPLGYAVALSFTPFGVGAPHFVFGGLDNYVSALGDSLFTNSVVTTFVIAVGAVVLEVVLGLALAILLSQRFRGMKLARVALLFPMMTPPLVVGVVWKTLLFPATGPFAGIFSSVGIVWPDVLASSLGARAAVIVMDVWEYTPFVMLILLAGIQSIPSTVSEAAQVDGARSFGMFRFVILPYITPVIIVAVIFRLLTAAKMFDTVYVLTRGGPSFSTDVISSFVQRTFVFAYELSYASAAAIMFMVVMFILALVLTRVMRRSSR
jgi:multiple sugar transport system permease protein